MRRVMGEPPKTRRVFCTSPEQLRANSKIFLQPFFDAEQPFKPLVDLRLCIDGTLAGAQYRPDRAARENYGDAIGHDHVGSLGDFLCFFFGSGLRHSSVVRDVTVMRIRMCVSGLGHRVFVRSQFSVSGFPVAISGGLMVCGVAAPVLRMLNVLVGFLRKVVVPIHFCPL
jgi:hypothetical protein